MEDLAHDLLEDTPRNWLDDEAEKVIAEADDHIKALQHTLYQVRRARESDNTQWLESAICELKRLTG